MRASTLLVLLVAVTATNAQDKRPFEIEDLFRFKRVSSPQISPDGSKVVYSVTTTHYEANAFSSDLWIADSDGKQPPRQLTNAATFRDGNPRWSPDGRHILFSSNRSGNSQLWLIGLDGGEARQLTNISTGASDGIWSRDGSHVAFVSAVYPEFSTKPFEESDKLNRERTQQQEKSPVKARVFTKLFFRHWDSYVEDKRQHLFVQKGEPGATPHDATPGDRDAYPTSGTFSSGDDFTFSPDGKYLVFTAVPAKNEAWSTNYDICRVPIDNKSEEWETLTKNPAADGGPKFSPDGTKLAYRAQKTPGFEADKWELMVVDCDASGKFAGEPRSLTADLDRSVDEIAWDGNSGMIFQAEENAASVLFHLTKLTDATPHKLVMSGSVGTLSISTSRGGFGQSLAFVKTRLTQPAEVYVMSLIRGGFTPQVVPEFATVQVSHANDELLAKLDIPKPESVTVPVEDADMQMWILKPPGFDPNKKWPLVYLVHGGPQGAWTDGWSYRWNPALWAAQGYVVAAPNPRGSTGFGQKFTNEITGDWGGKVYDDLMKGLDYLEELPYIDKNRKAAAGASYGGYMMNWFAVQNDRFDTLITHCGVWNFDSMYMTTEELWFDEWEHEGTPWGGSRKSYEKFSPHKFAGNLGKFKTPMLVIHNDLDFRVPISEGIQLFTALQRQGVPSRMINFPDEGHWVLKPRNSDYWHREVFAWLKKYVPPGGK